jgi:hypothetical protein
MSSKNPPTRATILAFAESISVDKKESEIDHFEARYPPMMPIIGLASWRLGRLLHRSSPFGEFEKAILK